MASFEIDPADRAACERLLESVKREVDAMKVAQRFMFAIEIMRHLKPEIDELKRRAKGNDP